MVIIKKREGRHEPAIGRCERGREMELPMFTNTCECGRDYNSSGQLLAPREQWGEDTGESYADIRMADVDPWGDSDDIGW